MMNIKGEIRHEAFELSELDAISDMLIRDYGSCKVWLFEGMLGAGKTTLIQSICKKLGVEDDINSPTFSIVNEYRTKSGDKVYHMDLYRLKGPEAAQEIGLYELADSGYFCLIEWASAIRYRPPFPHIQIDIQHQKLTRRNLEVRKYEN
jgi:tRNA threonylcarbamoyladenosine biosynthesis protein TsaE